MAEGGNGNATGAVTDSNPSTPATPTITIQPAGMSERQQRLIEDYDRLVSEMKRNRITIPTDHGHGTHHPAQNPNVDITTVIQALRAAWDCPQRTILKLYDGSNECSKFKEDFNQACYAYGWIGEDVVKANLLDYLTGPAKDLVLALDGEPTVEEIWKALHDEFDLDPLEYQEKLLNLKQMNGESVVQFVNRAKKLIKRFSLPRPFTQIHITGLGKELDQSSRPTTTIGTEEIVMTQTPTIAEATSQQLTTFTEQTATTTSDEEIIEAAARAEAATTLQINDCNTDNYTQIDIGLLEELGINLEVGQEIEMEEINEGEEEEGEIVDQFYFNLQEKNEKKIDIGNMLIVQRSNNIMVDTNSLNIIDASQRLFLRKVKPQFTNVTDFTILTDQFVNLNEKKWEKLQAIIKTEKKVQMFCIENLEMDDLLPIVTGWKLITSNLFVYIKHNSKNVDIKKIVKQLPFSKNNLYFTKKSFDKNICQDLKVMGCKLLNHPNEICKKEETLVIRLLKELISVVKN
ncbi:unnamed protein product [Dimorphilus gyrociliatus]|uniref:Uncharacterized protein n=1 Tax=Dimorphilus gyrociliatus TaxID=2664684 RepID=A0A7I8WDU0_9ANNE|nr:unnamed protein product [Dimorphilus gyrociliatus]